MADQHQTVPLLQGVRTGQCLCGAVRVSTPAANTHVHACHCSMCRIWGGGPGLSLDCGTAFTVEGEAQVQVYASSEWAERAFCKVCGTHLYYRLKQGNLYYVPSGLFADQTGLELTSQIYSDHKPQHYNFAEQIQTLTEAEFLAMLQQDNQGPL